MKKASRLLAAGLAVGGVMAVPLENTRSVSSRAQRGIYTDPHRSLATTDQHRSLATLRVTNGAENLSLVDVDHHAAAYVSFEDFWGRLPIVNLPTMANAQHQHDRSLPFQPYNDPPIAPAITPQACVRTGERAAKLGGIIRAGHALR